MKLLLVIALATVAAGFKADPFKYLEEYGYYQSKTFSGLDEAVMKFQKFAHLPVTGILDDATLKMMEMPRCGDKDIMPASSSRDVRKKRYIASSRYRRSRQLTYRFLNYSPDLGRNETRRIIRQAMDIWSNVTNVSFREITSGSATLMILFQAGHHGDIYPFDGRGGVIAHAFYPDGTGVHFDEDEEFTDGENRGRNLLWVATHELGHSLGLPHSDVYEALMYPFYKGYVADFKLPADDTGAVQALYGCKQVNTGPVSIPQSVAPYDGLLMERWLNTAGNRLHHIEPDVCIYPHQPDSATVLQSFNAPASSSDDFATRIRGYYRASQDGYHRFFLCADYSAKLYVSSSQNPADKHELVKVDRPTSKELRKCKQQSTSGHLRAGQLYYIEAVHKDNDGDDFLKVGVQPEGGKLEMMTSQNTKWALIDTDIHIMICFGRYEAITCPNTYKIEIVNAAFGLLYKDSQFNSNLKRLCNFGSWRYGTTWRHCKAKSSYRDVNKTCHGKQQCTLYAHHSAFSDHCGERVYSALDVTYRCVKTPTVATPVPTTRPTTTPPTTQAPCEDRPREARNCPSWKKVGYCQSSPLMRNYYCRKTCGTCIDTRTSAPTNAPSTTKATCEDRPREAPSCPAWKKAGYCQTHPQLPNYYCRKTCGTCT